MTREKMIKEDIVKAQSGLFVYGICIEYKGITKIITYNCIFTFIGTKLAIISVNGYDISTKIFFEMVEKFNKYPTKVVCLWEIQEYPTELICASRIDTSQLGEDATLVCDILDEYIQNNWK